MLTAVYWYILGFYGTCIVTIAQRCSCPFDILQKVVSEIWCYYDTKLE